MAKELLNRLEYIDYLISSNATGTPKQLSSKLKICDRAVYLHLNLMKELGAPIKFSRKKNSYYYTREGRLSFKFYKS